MLLPNRGMTLEKDIARSNIGGQILEGKMILQFAGQIVPTQGDKNNINVDLINQEIDIPILMMMLEATLFKAELIEPGFINTIRLVL